MFAPLAVTLYNMLMEKQIKTAVKEGYTHEIHSQVLDIHVFNEEFLSDNTSNPYPESLADISFTDTNFPCLTHSELIYYPETNIHFPELQGRVTATMPYLWVKQKYDLKQIMGELKDFLDGESLIAYTESQVELDGYTVLIDAPNGSTWDPISIDLNFDHEAGVIFDLEIPLSASNDSNNQYDEIIFGTSVWGMIHDFIADAGEDGNTALGHGGGSPHLIYIGATDTAELSDVEHIIFDALGRYSLLASSLPTPEISDKADYPAIEESAILLSSQEITNAIYSAIIKKRANFQQSGKMKKITTKDIIRSINAVQNNQLK